MAMNELVSLHQLDNSTTIGDPYLPKGQVKPCGEYNVIKFKISKPSPNEAFESALSSAQISRDRRTVTSWAAKPCPSFVYYLEPEILFLWGVISDIRRGHDLQFSLKLDSSSIFEIKNDAYLDNVNLI